MKRTVFERVSEFVESRPESKNSLAGLCGMSAQTFGRYVNGENKVTVSLIESLLRAFPNLSSDWLIRGEGPMYISDIPADGDSEQVLDLKAELMRKQGEIEGLRQTIADLKAAMAKREAQLDKLINILHEERQPSPSPTLTIVAEEPTYNNTDNLR